MPTRTMERVKDDSAFKSCRHQSVSPVVEEALTRRQVSLLLDRGSTIFRSRNKVVLHYTEEAQTKTKMKALGYWLMVVGSLRLASVWFGFFNIWALRLAVFSQTTMSEVHGRTFGVWTLLTCTLCFLCAFNPDNKPLYLATFLSFIYALGHFLTEYLFYHTMTIANLSTVAFFAGTSIVWMLLEWNSLEQPHSKLS